MNEMAVSLFDCSLLKVVAYLNIAFMLPFCARLFKAGMQEREDQLSLAFERCYAVMQCWQVCRDIHKNHIRNRIIECVLDGRPCGEILLQISDAERFRLLSLHGVSIPLRSRLDSRYVRASFRQEPREIALTASRIENGFTRYIS